MIDMDPKTVALICSSLFAAIGLLLNFRVVRLNNRIAVSTKLSDLSRLLSDEHVALVEMQHLINKELKEVTAHAVNELNIQKIQSLNELLDKNIKRQNELKSETDYLKNAFLNIDKVDIGGLDAKIAQSYRAHRIAELKLSFAEKQKLNSNS